MRKLLSLIFLAAVLWSVYWLVVSFGVRSGIEGWLDDRQSEGWMAEAQTVRTAGFPVAFDAAVEGLELADPATGLAWSLPELRIEAASFQPTRLRVIWPEDHVIASPLERIRVNATRMDGLIDVAPDTALTLREGAFAFEDVSLASNAGWSAALEDGTLSVVRLDGEEARYDLVFEALALRPADPVLATLDPVSLLPETVERVRIDATMEFDRPWDRFAIEDRRPQPRKLDLSKLDAVWGELALEAAGELDIDEAGAATGRIAVRATNWREILEVFKAAGAVPEAVAPTIERALEVLAGLSGNPNTIDAPLSFQKGFVSFGPIPLGPAPRFVIR